MDVNEELNFLWKFQKKSGGGCRGGGGVRVDVNGEVKVLWKIKKKRRGGGGQGGCERRSEVFVKNSPKKNLGAGGGGRGVWGSIRGGSWWIWTKGWNRGGGGGERGRVDVSEEVWFLWKIPKKKVGGSGGSGSGEGGGGIEGVGG